MKVMTHRVQGKLLREDGRHSLLLLDPEPAPTATADTLYLRYAFVLHGVETSIFPAELLDDWGNVVKGWDLYQWVLDYVDQFPRAEIFGFDSQGQEKQYFLRDLEVVEPLRCYAYADKTAPLTEGILLAEVWVPTAGITEGQEIERPTLAGKRPLPAAKLTWRQVPLD